MGFALGMSAEGESAVLVFLESFFSFLAGLFPQGHFESISRVLEDDCNNAFFSALTAFSMASFQESSSWPQAFNRVRIEGLRPSQSIGS